MCVYRKIEWRYTLQDHSLYVISYAPSALVASTFSAIHIKIYCLIRPMSM